MSGTKTEKEDLINLEQRKIKALEKIANSLDALTIWFEEIDKDEWSNRIQYYLAEWHNTIPKSEEEVPKVKKNGK
jgi:hypothetical protein